ncbi:hypothetical protein [Ligilactobacillus equi]|nr:hypothetical protein [Ligilactobacillus equi]
MDEVIGNLWISPNITENIEKESYYNILVGNTINLKYIPTKFSMGFLLTVSGLDKEQNHTMKIEVKSPMNEVAPYTLDIAKEQLLSIHHTDSFTISGDLNNFDIIQEGIYTFSAYIDGKELNSYRVAFKKEGD